jgi:putative serine protease PepD
LPHLPAGPSLGQDQAVTRRRLRLLAPVAAALCLASCSSSTGNNSTTSPRSSGGPTLSSAPPAGGAPLSAQQLQDTFTHVVDTVLPQVVQIKTDSGLGSGIVFDGAGDIVTNAHVVAQSSSFQVTLSTGKTYAASLVGAFVPDDLAVVRLQSPPPGLQVATFADSSKLRVGDLVMAVGNPLGLQSSVTEGIVSATGRTVSEGNGVTIPDAIQTSAAINPGNSGGALVDLNANVVGIPTLAATDPQLGGGAAPGIGFAIPSNTVRDIAAQLIANNGRVTNSHRAYMGVRVATVTGGGVVLASIDPGGPADRAGLKAGDVVSQINGHDTPDAGTLQSILATLKPGDVARVSVIRADGSQQTVSVTLGELPGS